VKRLVLFFFFPEQVWRDLRAYPQSPLWLFATIVLPFSFVISLAHYVGWNWFGSDWSTQYGYGDEHLFGSAALLSVWLSVMAAPVLMAAIFSWLAPWCGGRRDFNGSFIVATYGTLPLFIAGCFLFLMPMIVLCLFAFAYSCYFYMQGARVVLGVPLDGSPDLLVGTMIMLGAVMSCAALGVGALTA
jgi:ABC-type sulfate transport system permease component